MTGSFGAFCTSAAGCSHEIESPDIGTNAPPGAVTPDLACNAKTVSAPFTTVTIRGTNMTPMPSKTLEDKRELILPKVALTMVTPLAGATQLAEPLVIKDDAGDPNAARRVHWTSESEMSFDIFEEDKLPTGVMTITVTNPDGKKSANIEKTLAIVPKPTIAELKPPSICDDQADQTVVIAGSNFLTYDGKTPSVKVGDKTYTATFDAKDCAPVEGNFAEKNVMLCSMVTIKIPKGDFPVTAPTKVDVVVTNPAPADCATSETIQLTINPPPQVDSVNPTSVCEGGSVLTINGKGFEDKATVTMDCSGKRVDASTVTVTPDGKQISATFGGGATPGESCDVIVKNPDGCEDRPLPHKKVTIVTGPIVFYADPPIVYNGVNMPVTVFATTIDRSTPSAVGVSIRPSAGGTEIPLPSRDVPDHPNRLQVTVPKGQSAGEYDITLKDASGCFATLPKGLKVVDKTEVTIKNVVPPFGWTGADTSITVFRDTAAAAPANKPFVDSPRLFLAPSTASASDLAVPITGTSFLDADRVTGTVPKGTAVNKYDLLVVNPDGTVGLLKNAYDELADKPPVINTVTPSSIVAATGQVVTVSGANFSAGATVSLRCQTGAGASATAPATISGTGTTTRTVTIDGTAVGAGGLCILRITNADGSYGEYSAIGVTNSSLNLTTPVAGTALNVARRALSAAAGYATTAQRFVYAIGGDSGAATGALDSYEFASVDLFGKMGAWTTSSVKLGDKRTLAGAATIGRYIYNVGGDNGAGPVQTAERALILSPRETPEVTDVDLALEAAGLDEGTYHYRVSAVFATTDTDNPGGESLASDEFTLRVPAFATKKVAVTVLWRRPVDALGADLPGVSGYKIYRSAKDGASGTEVLLATVPATELKFKDDGTKALGTEKPLPVGSTGAWLKLPDLTMKRSGPAVAWATDPADATKVYVYALGGKTGATTATGSYDFLPVNIAANGRQTYTATVWTAGTNSVSVPRFEAGAWIVSKATTNLITNTDTWIFLGGGRGASGTLVGNTDAAKVATGGQLGAWTASKSFGADASGYGVCAANGQLFAFGGKGGLPFNKAVSASFDTSAGLPALVNWNNESITMVQNRYLMGSAVQSAFIFLIGGSTSGTALASKTTETVIW